MRMASIATVSLVLLLLAATGCGGSSGTAPPPEPPLTLLQGTYTIAGLQGNAGEPAPKPASLITGRYVAGVNWGPFVADGRGNATAILDQHGSLVNLSGSTEEWVTLGSEATFTYEETEERLTLAAVVSGGARPLSWSGYLSPDGEVALLAAMEEGLMPGVFVLVRRAEMPDPSVLQADYRHAAWWLAPAAPQRVSAFGTSTLASGGVLTVEHAGANVNGTYVPGPSSVTGTWSCSPTGDLAFATGAGPLPFGGGTGLGGHVLLAAGPTEEVNGPLLQCLVRRATPLVLPTEWPLSYGTVGFAHDSTTDEFIAYRGGLVLNQDGTCRWTPWVNRAGHVAMRLPSSGTWTHDLSGRLEIALPGTGTFEGGLLQGLSFAVIGGGTGVGTLPMILFLVRR